jgi:hypothetical protein
MHAYSYRRCVISYLLVSLFARFFGGELDLQMGGPSWTVLLGRRDSTTASKNNAERDLPPPTFDLANLTASFANKNLSVTDMVALSGTHNIEY